MLEFFLSVATAFGNLTSWFARRDEDERERIAVYFEQIAACLREVAERIEAGDAPRDTCRRLAVFADELEGILGARGYLTAAGDASIDETRMRLAGELKKAQTLWDPSILTNFDSVDLAREDLRTAIEVTAMLHNDRYAPSEVAVDRVATELAERMTTNTSNAAQPVWDAAGEFAALASTIRAR